MSIVAHDRTDDRISLTASDGTVFEYSSAAAQQAGSPAAAREAFYVAVQAALADHIEARSIYLGIDDQFRFTDLELVNPSPDNPPPLRAVNFTKDGDLELVAFDGVAHTILATEIKQTPDAKTNIETKLAELLIPEGGTAKYEVAVSTNAKGDISDLTVKGAEPAKIAPKQASEVEAKI